MPIPTRRPAGGGGDKVPDTARNGEARLEEDQLLVPYQLISAGLITTLSLVKIFLRGDCRASGGVSHEIVRRAELGGVGRGGSRKPARSVGR
jgi:hypothetical protein